MNIYLDRYAFQLRELEDFLPSLAGQYTFGLCVPLRGEEPQLVHTLWKQISHITPSAQGSVLVIAVINENADSPSAFKTTNKKCVSQLHSSAHSITGRIFLEKVSPHCDVLWLNFTENHCFKKKQGVGFARKIGCDVLLKLFSLGKLKCPWLWTTDADAFLPIDYFSEPKKECGAVHYTYRHNIDNFDGADALVLYEVHLRYYVLGLFWADSPFAYPSIGSCLTLNALRYAQVRGFPDREAGEDFHLLNKLRKLSEVTIRRSHPVFLKGRFSQRVPFGTGQSTVEIHELLQQAKPFTLYSPKTFEYLKILLQEVTILLQSTPDRLSDQFYSLQQRLSLLEPATPLLLEELKIGTILEQALCTRNDPANRLAHFHASFDALKTLRLIHGLERHHCAPVPWNLALKQAPFLSPINNYDDPRICLEQLQRQEEDLMCS